MRFAKELALLPLFCYTSNTLIEINIQTEEQ